MVSLFPRGIASRPRPLPSYCITKHPAPPNSAAFRLFPKVYSPRDVCSYLLRILFLFMHFIPPAFVYRRALNSAALVAPHTFLAER